MWAVTNQDHGRSIIQWEYEKCWHFFAHLIGSWLGIPNHCEIIGEYDLEICNRELQRLLRQ
jgi:hypothetical protein